MSRLSRLKISEINPHLIETEGGAPFPILGDTAWELFHRLTLEEIDHYFHVRSREGFNMVWANLLAEFDGLRTPNRYGQVPLLNLDPSQPNQDYFEFVDQVVTLAEQHHLYLGLLPAWGDKLSAPWGDGPVIFTLENLGSVRAYADWLGRRYAHSNNLIWVLGGDRPAKLFGPDDQFPMKNALQAGLERTTDWTPIWAELARGLKEAGATQLVTYHPQGGNCSTSVLLHKEEWLDINSIQSGHGGGHDVPIWNAINRDYRLLPVKPTLDAEPNYEDSPVNPWPVWDPATGFFDDFDVRKQIYRSIFAGGCGAIYGNHCVWQFASELYEPVLEVRFNWKEALHRPGAVNIGYLASLLRKTDFLNLSPTQDRILSDHGAGGDHSRAIGSSTETLVYVPNGQPVEIDLKWSDSRAVEIEEFDPSTGQTVYVNESPDITKNSLLSKPVRAERDRVIHIFQRHQA